MNIQTHFAAPDLADLQSQLSVAFGGEVEMLNDFSTVLLDTKARSVVVDGTISSVFVFQHEGRLKAILLPFGMAL